MDIRKNVFKFYFKVNIFDRTLFIKRRTFSNLQSNGIIFQTFLRPFGKKRFVFKVIKVTAEEGKVSFYYHYYID